MIDFHSHILPAIDDGSKSVDESIAMLNMLSNQGVEMVVATPHYSISDGPIEAFLEKREKAYNAIYPHITKNMPKIMFGAEVEFFRGMSKMKELSSLRIKGTKLLMIEMPMTKWRESDIQELVQICCLAEIMPVLAHIERYFGLVSRRDLEILIKKGVLIQTNCSAFFGFFTRRKIIKMIKCRYIHFFGSDCHNMTSRPPKFDKMNAILKKHFSPQEIDRFYEKQKKNMNI